jgi:flagellar basal-body rod protein FlgC
MSELLSALALSASGMRAQSTRLRLVSENIANTDTPGFRRKVVAFEPAGPPGNRGAEGVRAGPVRLDRAELARIYDPGHPLADASGHYEGSNVNLMIEVADAREAQRSYEANLSMFDQARQMSSALLDLLKR